MDKSARILIVALVLSIVGGIGIVVFNKDYRVNKILETNKDYYPGAATSSPPPEEDEGY